MPFNTNALRHAREQRGWSQAQVAREVGTDARSVSRWERGVTRPSPYFRQRLGQLFALDVEALGHHEPPSSAPSSPTVSVFSVSLPSPEMQTPSEPLLDPARPHLHLPTSQMIERPAFFEQIFASLETGTPCVLYGLPGVGKTMVVQQLSLHSSCLERFPDGLLWIRLGPTPQVQHELRRLASLLSIPEEVCREVHEIHALSHLLHQVLGERRILLVIDDAWHTQDVQPFLIGGQHTAHLITTRLPEVAFALTRGMPLLVPELTTEQSQHLLQSLVPQLVENVEYQEQLSLLHRATGGLPLALTLIGHLLRRQMIGGQVRRVQAVLTHLSEGLHAVPALFTTALEGISSLESLLALSEQPLSSTARQTLRALAVLPAKPMSFSEAVALALCEQRKQGLDELLDVGLLEGAGEGRYQMHQIIADYARLHLSDEKPYQRLLTYVLEASQEAMTNVSQLKEDWAVLESAWRVAEQRGWKESLIKLGLRLETLWYALGAHRLAEARLQQIVVLAKELQEYESACKAFILLSLSVHMQGDIYRAQQWGEEGLHLAQAHHLTYQQGRAHANLGSIARTRGELKEAEKHFQTVLCLADDLSTPHTRLAGLMNLGVLHFDQGQFLQAESYWLKGLAISEQENVLDWHCIFLRSMCALSLSLGNQMERAEMSITKAQGIANQLHDHFEQTVCTFRRAQVAFRQGDAREAERLLYEMERLLETSDHLNQRYQLWVEGALLFVQLGQVAQAETWLLRVVPYSSYSGIVLLARVQEQLVWGEVRLAQQRPEEAVQHFQAIDSLCPPSYRVHYLHRNYGLARAFAALGQTEEAQRLAQECLFAMQQCDYWQRAEVQAWLEQLNLSCSTPVPSAGMLSRVNTSPAEMSCVEVSCVEVSPVKVSHVDERVEHACPRCHGQRVIRRGKDRQGTQRYLCHTCQRTFSTSSRSGVSAYPLQIQEQARQLASQGESLRAIARTLHVHHETVRRWLEFQSHSSPVKQ